MTHRAEDPTAHRLHAMWRDARHIFEETLRRVDVRGAVARNLWVEGTRLMAGGGSFELCELDDVLIVASGKAAAAMYEAAASVLREAGWPTTKLRSVVVAPTGREHSSGHSFGDLQFFAGAHPTPDVRSAAAAEAVLRALRVCHARTLVLFLISGGSSAMLELPLDPSISIEEVAEFHRLLVASGVSIGEMNTLRKHLSAVKGGRLALAAADAAQCSLVVSDVPRGALDVVGSGPSLPDSSSREECMEIFGRLRARHALPREIVRFFEEPGWPETPKLSHPVFGRAVWKSILSGDDLAQVAVAAASEAGYLAEIDNRCDEWRCEDAVQYLLDRSARLVHLGGRHCLVSVGEVAVTLPGAAGVGGRNQHFALEAAWALRGGHGDTVVLSAGSDGIDGNSAAAGALADRTTCGRAEEQGLDPAGALRNFNSSPLFQALGDAIMTGSTGNNLRDLRLILTECA